MDRRVKERLVGASILVALIVLIVPELLSGPVPNPPAPNAAGAALPSAAEPVRNVTVDIAAGRAAAIPETAPSADVAAAALHGDAQPVAAAAQRPTSVQRPAADQSPAADESPAADQSAAATQSAATERSPAASAAPASALETPAPSPRSTAAPVKTAAGTHSWSVQLGSFASHANADKLVRQMRAQGFAVYVLTGGSQSTLRYRVRIGPMADRAVAAQMMAKLKAQGHVSSLVPPGH